MSAEQIRNNDVLELSFRFQSPVFHAETRSNSIESLILYLNSIVQPSNMLGTRLQFRMVMQQLSRVISKLILIGICAASPSAGPFAAAYEISSVQSNQTESVDQINGVMQDRFLNPEFSQRFRTLSDLTTPKIVRYVSEYPSQITAVHNYLQRLVSDNYIDFEFANSTIRQVTNQLSKKSQLKPKKEIALPTKDHPTRPPVHKYDFNDPRKTQAGSANSVAKIRHENTTAKTESGTTAQLESDSGIQDEGVEARLLKIEGNIERLEFELRSDDEEAENLVRTLSAKLREIDAVIQTGSIFTLSIRKNVGVNESDLQIHLQTLNDLSRSLSLIALELNNLGIQLTDNAFRIEDSMNVVSELLNNRGHHSTHGMVKVKSSAPLEPRLDAVSQKLIGLNQETVRVSQLVNQAETDIQDAQDALTEQRDQLSSSGADIAPPNKALNQQDEMMRQAGELLSNENPEELIIAKAKRTASREIKERTRQKLFKLFDNASVSIDAGDGSPSFQVSVLDAYDGNGEKNQFAFTQFGINGYDGRTTLNLGGGYRYVSDNDLWMLGGNIFYDHEFPYDHQRASVGLEFISSPVRINANKYLGISGYKSDKNGEEAKPLDGYDVTASVAVPYFPGLFVKASQFQWDGEDGRADLKGQDLGLQGNLSDGVSVEVYQRDYDAVGLEDQTRVRLAYQWNLGEEVTPLYRVSSQPFVLKPIKTQRYRLVTRENRIVKQKKSGLTVSAL